jgi:SAM-dependent methyltransferase
MPKEILDENQKKALFFLKEKIRDRRYGFVANPCLCSAKNDISIASEDRYGLHVETKLCLSCGLMRTDPFFDNEALVNFYNEDYRSIYSQSLGAAKIFEEEYSVGKRIVGFLGDISFGMVFEIGCGAGGTLSYLKEISKASVVGCDYGAEYLQYAKDCGITVEVGGAASLTGYGSADLIILHHVLEHFIDPVKELASVLNLLADDGKIFIALPGVFYIRKTYGEIALFLQNAHAWHFCLDTLDFLMSLCGLTRLKGNEEIYAVYKKANFVEKNQPSCKIASRIISYLKWIELIKWIPNNLPYRAYRKIKNLYLQKGSIV